MDRFEQYSRLGGDDRFRWITERNLDTFETLDPKFKKMRAEMHSFLSECENPEDPPTEYHFKHLELDSIEEERDQSCIVAVVFTAMYFEAFIYDYAASCLGDKYSKDHLDKLDFVSKWLVIPKLITGKEISKSGQAYEALKRLNKDRNSLVHLKSREMSFNAEEMASYLERRETDIQESVKNCRKALKYVLKELLEIDPDHPKVMLASESRNKSKHADAANCAGV
ncbi:hypothetical protein [Hydrocarboniclastica marina]|uniref:RiboL-PSP-HEPN domain-containing protein n=1 Tax=Hydrocarboniclastica marina TaxID=2259620 RepID=A0A4P7XD83_9ALTE|nr:hypothetical protein [Hydrocarboniclastica marina]QCF24839.1 hypothetical protein soil367_02070 [Hydrocarboniclastica marina]